MERFSGFYGPLGGRGTSAGKVNVARRTITRTAIENPLESVQQSSLYSLEALEWSESMPRFLGTLQVNPPAEWGQVAAAAAQQSLIDHLAGPANGGNGQSSTSSLAPLNEVAVGAARTRGLGSLKLELESRESSTLSHLTSLEERLELTQKAWGDSPGYQPGTIAFPLTLHSDAIVMDSLWRYVSVMTPEILAREVPGMPDCSLRQPYFTSVRVVSGWNSVQKLPKEDELAIVRGSAFLYITSVDKNTLLDWLRTVEEQGIGERRTEGFGRVIACHPFHWEGFYRDYRRNTGHTH